MLKLQHKILLLDDEPSNLGLLERIFSRNPHQLFKTETPEEAFEVLENHDISVVISDYRMPAMTGIEFLKEVEQHHPTVVRILCTGLADLNEFKEALTSGLLYGYIVKPFKIFEISLLVERALELYELTKERDKLKQDWEITKRETTALLEAGTSVSSSRDVNLTLSRLVRAICTNFGYQCCSIELIDRTTWELYIKASYGFPIEVQKKRLPIEGRGVVCYVARTGKQICLNNASADERYVPNNPDTRSQLAVPLMIGQEIIGVLNIESNREDDFSDRDLFLMTSFANKAAWLIQQAHLFELVSRAKTEWETTFDAMTDPVFIFDNKQRLKRVNKAGAKMFNRSYETLLGERCEELFPDKDRAASIAHRLFLKGQRVVDKQFFGEEKIPIILTAEPLLNEKKELVGCLLIVRVQPETNTARLSSRNSELVKFLSNSLSAILILNPEGKVVWVNTRAEQLLERNFSELEQTSFDLLFPEHYRSQARRLFRQAILGESHSIDAAFHTPEGQVHQISLSASTVSFEQEVAGVIVFSRSPDEKRRSRHNTLETDKLRALGQLASGVAHDFNNILAAILGRSQLMQKRVQDPELLHSLQIIERAARDGANMARRIKDFGRPRKSREDHTPVEIGKLITDAIAVTAPRWKDDAEDLGRVITVEFEKKGEIHVLGDESELREVLTNLIINSVDALPEGGEIKIEYGSTETSAFIHVIDNGIGIPKEVQKHIFEAFYTTKGELGTGLGLNISQNIVMDHGGIIEVESQEGAGTKMRIALPLLEPNQQTQPALTTAEYPVIPCSKILVVDDEEDVRELLADMIASFGHDVEVADSAAKAVVLLQKSSFDLLITDFGMPQMNGRDLAQRAKELNGTISVILCTGWGEVVSTELGGKKIVDYIVSKPFDLEKLSYALRQVL